VPHVILNLFTYFLEITKTGLLLPGTRFATFRGDGHVRRSARVCGCAIECSSFFAFVQFLWQLKGWEI